MLNNIKKNQTTILIVVIVAIAAYFLYTKYVKKTGGDTNTEKKQDAELSGSEKRLMKSAENFINGYVSRFNNKSGEFADSVYWGKKNQQILDMGLDNINSLAALDYLATAYAQSADYPEKIKELIKEKYNLEGI